VITRRSTTLRRATLGLVAALCLGACANTIDPDVTADPVDGGSAPVATDPFQPTGTPAELLAGLLDEATTLSEAIIENEGDNEILARVDAYWAAAEPQVAEQDESLARDIDRAVAMMHTGVQRRRPADADKATINLRTLIAAFDR
jgi:hypothetical protein